MMANQVIVHGAHSTPAVPYGMVSRHGVWRLAIRFEGPWRIDRYTPFGSKRGHEMRCMAAGPNDVSEQQQPEPSSFCSCCWLGVDHTVDYHRSQCGSLS
jgi:hypothetical protein